MQKTQYALYALILKIREKVGIVEVAKLWSECRNTHSSMHVLADHTSKNLTIMSVEARGIILHT